MNPTTIAEMHAKAAELRAKYPDQTVIVEAQVWATNYAPKEAPHVDWRIHVIAEDSKNLPGDAITGSDLDAVEAQIHKVLDPTNRHQRALARAEKLEAEAAALRASVGGAA